MLYNLDKDKSLKLSCGLTTVANRVSVERYPVLIFNLGDMRGYYDWYY